MPMYGSFDRQLIVDKYFKIVSFVGFNQRPRLLAVDEIHFTSDAVCGSSVCTSSKSAGRATKCVLIWSSDCVPGALDPL